MFVKSFILFCLLLPLIHCELFDPHKVCFADKEICKDRVHEAIKEYPKYQESIYCAIKIAFIEPNPRTPKYTKCINEAREDFAGEMIKGGTFNPVNLMHIQNAIDNHKFRREIGKCMLYIDDCYDVRNLRNCLRKHEHL